ncbi:uncharacterized protein LOC108672621 [Hyalella azteca]|uniref:Uncharacterized protein LOC108672621 n=1 Tax=Hyalella azteca TaxID=294128 RepID=A0A979FLF6_HYAAZ|nr:uncharacterized protein LOC108672621 [Hyalella azteca]
MATTTEGTAVGTAHLTVLPRGPGRILLVVMGLLGSIAVVAVTAAVVATYRRRRRRRRGGGVKPTPPGGGYVGSGHHPASQASATLLPTEDCHRQSVCKNGVAPSLNGGFNPRCVRPPCVQGRVGDSGALPPQQEGLTGRYQDPGSASVYLSGQQGLNDSSGGSDYKPPLTPLADYHHHHHHHQLQQQQPYQQIASPQPYHVPPQQYPLPPQQHLLTTQQPCGLSQPQHQYQTPLQPCSGSVPQVPQQLQYHQLDVI